MGTFSSSQTDITDVRIAIVVSRFNEKITSALLDGAMNELDKRGVDRDHVDVYYVPGSMELAVVARKCALKGVDAVICLGAVVRGDTPHFEYVSNTSALSIADVATSTGVPCIFGVLTVNNDSQAQERIGGAHGHKGEEAAATALETIATLREVDETKKSGTGFTG
jgi:6,7-dimethyl-8-ribityllumazine synthase